MTNEEIVEAVRRMKRTAEMSAEIMRDRQRTGAWEGAEKVARQFDRLAERASDVFAALSSAGRLVGEATAASENEESTCEMCFISVPDARPPYLQDDGHCSWCGETRNDRIASAPHPAPDATDWKARCEAAEAGIRSWEITAKRINEEADKELTAAQAENEKLREALKPFADYADPSRRISPHLILTKGSALARRQLTMGDCYAALAALSPPPLSPEKE